MHAIGSCSQCHIDPVIDQKRHAFRLQQALQPDGFFDKTPGIEFFFPKLHHRNAAFHRLKHHIFDPGRCARLAVGDQINAFDLHGAPSVPLFFRPNSANNRFLPHAVERIQKVGDETAGPRGLPGSDLAGNSHHGHGRCCG